MIIWLASYPRSGNLLLRQILYTTMDQPSHHAGSDANEIRGLYSRDVDGSLDEFVKRAAETSERVLVKTHLAPRDEHPAIYVVRDGRAALSSFLKYERTFSSDHESTTMLRLILGDHHFGSWSEHYRAWHSRDDAPILTVNFDQLVDASLDTLQEIASFIGYDGDIAPWVNPIGEWRERYPELVGEGKTKWDPPEDWSFVCDVVFWALHGMLMTELQLDDGQRLLAPPNAFDELLGELLPVASGAIAQTRQTWAASVEKEAEIAIITRECNIQTRAAAERLETIEQMKKELDLQAEALLKARDDLEAQAQAASERLKVIEELTVERDLQAKEAADRLQTIEELTQELDRQTAAASARLAMIEAIDRQRFG